MKSSNAISCFIAFLIAFAAIASSSAAAPVEKSTDSIPCQTLASSFDLYENDEDTFDLELLINDIFTLEPILGNLSVSAGSSFSLDSLTLSHCPIRAPPESI